MEKSHLTREIELRTRHSGQNMKEYTQRKYNRVRKCNFQWTSEATMLLIENVEKLENLWNTSYCAYKDRKTHQRSWERIANSLSLPKEEVVVKWNSLRSNYRIYLKNRRGSTIGWEGKQKSPHRFFLAMSFLDPVLRFDTKKNKSNLIKKEHHNKTISEGRSRSSSVVMDLENNSIDIPNVDSNAANISEIIEEISPPVADDENMPSVSQPEENPLLESKPPLKLLHKKGFFKRKMQILRKQETGDDLHSLQKTKLRLEIYNLQLDAVKKEIDLGIERSRFTEDLYRNWDIFSTEEL